MTAVGMTPMTPLRRAVWTCVRYSTPFGLADVEGLTAGQVARKAILGYLSALARRQIVVPLRHGWVRGPAAADWLLEAPRTNPGGRARAYLRAKEARDSLRVRAWKAAVGRELTPEERAAVCSDPGAAAPRVRAPLELIPDDAIAVTVAQAAAMLGRSENSIYDWVRDGRIKAGMRESKMFVPISEVRRLVGLT